MANNRYLEFDSSYRDRNMFPNPATFVVGMSQSGQATRENARDPVSNASPILVWNSSFREDAGATSITITAVDFTFAPSDFTTFIIEAAANQFRNVEDYYVGAVLSLTDTTPSTFRRRIVAYKRISTTQALVTVDSALGTPNGAMTGAIENPGNNTNTATVPMVFIPTVSNIIPNYYEGYLIQNISTGEVRTITFYDGVLRLATISATTAATWNVANENFVIRRELPTNTGTITAINSGAPVTSALLATNRAIQLASTASPTTGYYTASYMRMIEPVPTAPFSTTVAPYGQERRISRYIAGDGTFAAAAGIGTFTFNLGATASSDVDFYVGALLTNVTSGEIREIITYNPLTKSGTVAIAWTVAIAPGDVWRIRTAILSSTFTTAPVVGGADAYEIELFTRDNYVPFSYNGSMTSSQQEVCYEIELLNLILPNSVLQSGRGGRPAFYPYLYVELQAVAGSSGLHNSPIYSNNPNAVRMMFRAVVDDTPTPLISPFIKIDGDGMVHTLKFKPNDYAFRFGVYHANGEVFQTVEQDTSSPTEPNPRVQVSACFAFKRKD